MANSITIYGIKNCDTVKKTRGGLDTRGARAQKMYDAGCLGLAAKAKKKRPQ
jgi:hypothetical protein